MRPRSSPGSTLGPPSAAGPRVEWRPLKARPSSGGVQLLIKRVHSSTSSAGQRKQIAQTELDEFCSGVVFFFFLETFRCFSFVLFFYTEKNRHGCGGKYPSKKQENGK